MSWRLLMNLPKLVAIGSVLAPCYVVGGWMSRAAKSGDSLLVVARKLAGGS